jgi:hypothetical protein
LRAEQAGKNRFANPLGDSLADSSNFETVAKFAVTSEGTQNIGISASDSAEKEALSRTLQSGFHWAKTSPFFTFFNCQPAQPRNSHTTWLAGPYRGGSAD